MTSKRYNTTEQLISLDSPIRVNKLHRHTRGAKPYNASRRAVKREQRRRNKLAQQAQGEPANPRPASERTNPSKRNAQIVGKGVLSMNEYNPNQKSPVDKVIDNLVDLYIEVTLFDIVREYPDQVKAVIIKLFDQCAHNKNPLLAFFNSLAVAVVGKYQFNTVTKKVAFTTNLKSLKGTSLKQLMSPTSQKTKYTPAQVAMDTFLRNWLTRGIEANMAEDAMAYNSQRNPDENK